MKRFNAHCRFCGKLLVYANIPNRGPVMAHRHGEAELCRRKREFGLDLISIRQRRERGNPDA